MGWLFGWHSRKDLIKHLVENKGGAKVLKHYCSGNNLWLVYEHDGKRSVGLCMMKGPHNCGKGYTGSDKDLWGYKDVHETAGPYYDSCPESFLTMCTAPENTWAYEFRQRIYAKAQKKRQMKIGTKWRMRDMAVYEIIKRVSPTLFRVKDAFGDTWRVRTNQLLNAEML